MLRSRGVETDEAAVVTAASSGGRKAASSERVTPAPTAAREVPRSSGMAASEITVAGTCWRRFMLGYRSVPPATYIPAGPASAFHLSASARVAGARYLNEGSRSIRLRP